MDAERAIWVLRRQLACLFNQRRVGHHRSRSNVPSLNKPKGGVIDFLAHTEVVCVYDDSDFAQDFPLPQGRRSSTSLGNDDVTSAEKP